MHERIKKRERQSSPQSLGRYRCTSRRRPTRCRSRYGWSGPSSRATTPTNSGIPWGIPWPSSFVGTGAAGRTGRSSGRREVGDEKREDGGISGKKMKLYGLKCPGKTKLTCLLPGTKYISTCLTHR